MIRPERALNLASLITRHQKIGRGLIEAFRLKLTAGFYRTNVTILENNRTRYEAELRDGCSSAIRKIVYLVPQSLGKQGITIELAGGKIFDYDYADPGEPLLKEALLLRDILTNHLQPELEKLQKEQAAKQVEETNSYYSPQPISSATICSTIMRYIQAFEQAMYTVRYCRLDMASDIWQSMLINPMIRDFQSNRFMKADRRAIDRICNYLARLKEFDGGKVLDYIKKELGI